MGATNCSSKGYAGELAFRAVVHVPKNLCEPMRGVAFGIQGWWSPGQWDYPLGLETANRCPSLSVIVRLCTTRASRLSGFRRSAYPFVEIRSWR